MNISIIGMPLFYGCDKPGVEKGPEELRKNNLIDIFQENHTVYDLGDIEVEKVNAEDKFLSNSKLKYLDQVVTANNRLAAKVLTALENNTLPLIVGGDHSLALGSIAGIFFDDFKIKPENVFILACRDLDVGEVALINKLNMNVWTNKDINDKGTNLVINELLSLIKEKNLKNIHLSYDIDCLDPEYVPGTGTPVNNGLSYNESKVLLESILGTSLVKSIDFVEYNPDLDKNNRTKETCIELLKLISKKLK